MTSVLLLSNGHGEDLSGSLLGRELQSRGVSVEALPLVGHGEPYRRAGIAVLGSTREFSTGGLGYTSLAGRLTEALEGQVIYLVSRLRLLACSRRKSHRLVVVVGDVVPVLAAWLARLPTVVYLVAYSSQYEGRLRLPWPCGWLLRRPGVAAVWSRDALTADDLSRQLGRTVQFLGNPFLDPVVAPSLPLPPAGGPSLALLPGSRMPEARRNLERMLRVLTLLPARLRDGCLTCRAALVGDLREETINRMAEPMGWQLATSDDQAVAGRELRHLQGHGVRVELHWQRFTAVLAGADLVLSMTGTAAEQAVGLGKPVLQVVGDGPQFTEGFAEAQRRLLGPGVFCAPGPAGAPTTLQATARMAADLLERGADPRASASWRRQLAEVGEQRLGSPGGTGRMADAIMELLSAHRR